MTRILASLIGLLFIALPASSEPTPTTVADLPTCSLADEHRAGKVLEGALRVVTDENDGVLPLSGGGSERVTVRCQRGAWVIPSAGGSKRITGDTFVDADGIVSTASGSEPSISEGDLLTPLDRATTSAGTLCTDSTTAPTVVFLAFDGDCDVADGTNTSVLGSVPSNGAGDEGTEIVLSHGWAFRDTDGNGTWDPRSGDVIYIDSAPTEEYNATRTARGEQREMVLADIFTEDDPDADPECFWFNDESVLWVSCSGNGTEYVFDRATDLTSWSLAVPGGASGVFGDGGGEGCDFEILDETGSVVSSTTVGDTAGILETGNDVHTVTLATPHPFDAGDTLQVRISPASGDDCVDGDGTAIDIAVHLRLYGVLN